MSPRSDVFGADPDRVHYDVAILGGGTAATAVVGGLEDTELDPVVFEPDLVGGICPYVACVPTKGLLHDAAVGVRWSAARHRRDELTHGLDDAAHVEALTSSGATIVRRAARFADAGTLDAGDLRVTADHVVIATGARPIVPDLDGLDDVRDLLWTSDDATTSDVLPGRLLIVGGGVVGCEFAHLYAGFGCSVVVVDDGDALFPDLAPVVHDAVVARLRERLEALHTGTRPTAVRRHGDRIEVSFDDGSAGRFDRMLVAAGRRPSLDDLGVDAIGLDPNAPLPVGETGRVGCAGSVWAVGDVAGRAQYTHAAGHHGSVVADQLGGAGVRRFDDVVDAACMFTDPPLFTVGPSRAATVGDDDIVWADGDLDGVVRANTDAAGGALAVAGSRSSRCLVAAHGAGPRFDELVHAIVYAIDGGVPVDRLVQSMVPFPTMGNALQQRLLQLQAAL